MDRYCNQRPLPPYTYVTGLAPHPLSDPLGHSHGGSHPPPRPLTENDFRENQDYLYALDLFNHGYYWEAHEAWESLWHAAGRLGPTADFLKALIKLAAAGVKLKEGRPAGIRRHALRAIELLQSTATPADAGRGERRFGLSLGLLLTDLERLARDAGEQQPLPPDASRNLPIRLHLE